MRDDWATYSDAAAWLRDFTQAWVVQAGVNLTIESRNYRFRRR
jgi:hypothetical protein